MENLWAPWRMELIRQEKSPQCFFCEYLKQNQDQKNLILERAKETFVIFNRYPYNNGHLMVVPNQHTGTLSELTAPIRAQLMESTVRWQEILQKTISPDGFNIGINQGTVAGAGIKDHVHIHIVPRWNGDTNFMPVFAAVKVIPQALEELYLQLKKAADVF